MENNIDNYVSIIKSLNDSIDNVIQIKDIFNMDIQHNVHLIKKEIKNTNLLISEQRNVLKSNYTYISNLAVTAP